MRYIGYVFNYYFFNKLSGILLTTGEDNEVKKKIMIEDNETKARVIQSLRKKSFNKLT